MLTHLLARICFILGCSAAVLAAGSSTPSLPEDSSSTTDESFKWQQGDTTASTSLFLKEIFEKYGHNGVITLEGFEHLLENLGLGGLSFNSDHGISEHKIIGENTTFVNIHDSSHNHPAPKEQSTSSHDHDDHHPEDAAREHKKLDSTAGDFEDQRASSTQSWSPDNQSVVIIREKCMNTTEILSNINANPFQPNISVDNFMRLCPIIVYELDQQHCRFSPPKYNPNYLHDHDNHHTHDGDEELNSKNTNQNQPIYYVWFYSSMAVLIISISGMLCVAIIPVIQRCFYQQLIQYLVALAIGSLTGDALLHLLPHAMVSVSGNAHSHDHGSSSGGSHSQSVWIGLMALSGICLFFTAEQALNALNDWKQKRDLKKSKTFPMGALKLGDVELKTAVGDKLSKDINSYDYRYEEVTSEKNGDVYYDKNVTSDSDIEKAIVNKNNVTKEDLEKEALSPLFHSNYNYNDTSDSSVNVEHEASHHGHGHSHSHAVPTTAMATAWMVIAGDGLHNFSDGMAIGAAFSNGLTGGLSTAIAVFCHELPHELGDFALLLKAGMSIRQGLFYNGLSSVLCFLGMIVGLAIGNIESANAWVFAGAAGMFLYIALVDMIPELHNHNGEGSSLGRFAIQACGIATGITIMCVIALYEEDLQKTLAT